MTERQFRRAYETASKQRGDTAENLIGLLERRLDTVVYRVNLAPTPFAARQLVNHGHVLVNGKRVNIPSYQVREGDMVEVRRALEEPSRTCSRASSIPSATCPSTSPFDVKALKAQFVRVAQAPDVPYPVQMEPNLVIEYYSR